MKSTENSAQGAYDAGYYFCYNFEAPASRPRNKRPLERQAQSREIAPEGKTVA